VTLTKIDNEQINRSTEDSWAKFICERNLCGKAEYMYLNKILEEGWYKKLGCH